MAAARQVAVVFYVFSGGLWVLRSAQGAELSSSTLFAGSEAEGMVAVGADEARGPSGRTRRVPARARLPTLQVYHEP